MRFWDIIGLAGLYHLLFGHKKRRDAATPLHSAHPAADPYALGDDYMAELEDRIDDFEDYDDIDFIDDPDDFDEIDDIEDFVEDDYVEDDYIDDDYIDDDYIEDDYIEDSYD